MKKICYLLVALMAISVMSCQESEVAEQVAVKKGHIAVGVSLSGGMQDLMMKSPAQKTSTTSYYGGYEYGDQIPDQIFLVMASWKNATGNGHKLFVIDARENVSVTNPALDMEMFYGKNDLTFKAYGVATCSAAIKAYVTNGGETFPNIVGAPGDDDYLGNQAFDEYLDTWRWFASQINLNINGYVDIFESSRYEFIGRKSIMVTAGNSSEMEAENTITDMVLYRMVSQVNFDFSSILADIVNYPLYSWEFTLETAKMEKDLTGDEYLNITDNTLVEDLRNCTFLSEGLIESGDPFSSVLVAAGQLTNVCHVSITAEEGVKTDNQEYFRNMSDCVGTTDPRCSQVHSTWTHDNSYGAMRLSYILHTPSGDISGVINNIVGEPEDIVSTEILNLFILNTCYSIDFNINNNIYTDPAMNGNYQLVFKGLIGKEGTVVISDTENQIE